MPPATMSPTRSSVRVNASDLSYRRAGSGDVLLFLHGAASLGDWPPFLVSLAERYDVIVPDHPGFGQSPTPPWLDNVHDVAYAYLDFMQQLGLRDVNLIGHGLGGWIAAEIAVRSDRDLRSLALVAPAGIRVSGMRKLDTYMMSPEAIAQHSYVDPALQAQSTRPDPADEAAIDVYLKDQLNYARLGWQPRLFDPHLAKWLHRITVPTLVVWGGSDHVIPSGYLGAFLELIPNATGATIPDTGHFPQIEAPAVFLHKLDAFYHSLPNA
jgi:pimeloyl-ACP methyl ester carboxylesterase